MFPTLQSPMVVVPQLRQVLAGQPLCVAGQVRLLRFIQAPAPGEAVAQLTTLSGLTVPLVETAAAPLAGPGLAGVDGELSTVCGVLALTATGRLVLQVTRVFPGISPAAFTPANLCSLLPLALSPTVR